MTYKAAIPLIQGIALGKPAPGQPSALSVVQNTYGAWNEMAAYDPSQGLGRSVAQSALVSAVLGGVVGYMLPGFKPGEGVKWGALIGASRTLFLYFAQPSAAAPPALLEAPRPISPPQEGTG